MTTEIPLNTCAKCNRDVFVVGDGLQVATLCDVCIASPGKPPAPPMKGSVKGSMRGLQFEMQMDQALFDRIGEWRSKQRPIPSVAAAIRTLVTRQLDREGEDGAHISPGEQRILDILTKDDDCGEPSESLS